MTCLYSTMAFTMMSVVIDDFARLSFIDVPCLTFLGIRRHEAGHALGTHSKQFPFAQPNYRSYGPATIVRVLSARTNSSLLPLCLNLTSLLPHHPNVNRSSIMRSKRTKTALK